MWNKIKEYVKSFDGGVELGGLMINPVFVDIMLLNFFVGGKNYSLFHIQYVHKQKMWLVECLFIGRVYFYKEK